VAKKIRKNLVFFPKDVEALKNVLKITDAASLTEAIRRSARFTAELLRLQGEGGRIFIKKSDETEQEILVI
jgi:hypothetical protein